MATGMVMARPIIGGIEQAQEFQSGMTDIAQKANLTRDQADNILQSIAGSGVVPPVQAR